MSLHDFKALHDAYGARPGAADLQPPGGVCGAIDSGACVSGGIARTILDPASGQPKWERLVAPSGDHLDVDSLRFEGGTLYAAAFSGAVLALDAATGKQLWSFKSPGAARMPVSSRSSRMAASRPVSPRCTYPPGSDQ